MTPTDQDILKHLQTCYGGKWKIEQAIHQPIVRNFVDEQYGRSLSLRMDMAEKFGPRWKKWVDRQFAPLIGA